MHLLTFDAPKNKLLLDLVLMRIVEPCSKLESLEYLSEMFGISYKEGSLYQAIASLPALKGEVEKRVVTFARKYLNFDFSIVFYDVTTLYFESFKEDEEGLRRFGFSKDNKPNQPQILVGLIVNVDGFPVSYEVFKGNTFEGKTFIPSIKRFVDTYSVNTLTVVADAAMISLENIKEITRHNLSYIVGARMANIKPAMIKSISQKLNRSDGASMRIEIDCGLLICDFSLKRYSKDKLEMEKQIQKAQRLLQDRKTPRKAKFLKNTGKPGFELNTELIKKTELLLGIKGYHSNLVAQDNQTIINHYHNLWHVEKAFRIAKSDLNMRPIYHFKETTVKAHILICFMALSVSKYIELKTGKSIRRVVKLLKSVTDARILNTITGEEIIMRKKLDEEVRKVCETLMSY